MNEASEIDGSFDQKSKALRCCWAGLFIRIEDRNSLLNVERILPLFRNNPQFMQKVGVEVNCVPRVCVSVLSLSVFALAGVVEFVKDVP